MCRKRLHTFLTRLSIRLRNLFLLSKATLKFNLCHAVGNATGGNTWAHGMTTNFSSPQTAKTLKVTTYSKRTEPVDHSQKSRTQRSNASPIPLIQPSSKSKTFDINLKNHLCRTATVAPKEEIAAKYRQVRLPQHLDKFGGINWAGARHSRLNFHKHKDPIN